MVVNFLSSVLVRYINNNLLCLETPKQSKDFRNLLTEKYLVFIALISWKSQNWKIMALAQTLANMLVAYILFHMRIFYQDKLPVSSVLIILVSFLKRKVGSITWNVLFKFKESLLSSLSANFQSSLSCQPQLSSLGVHVSVPQKNNLQTYDHCCAMAAFASETKAAVLSIYTCSLTKDI